jgi:hypothetical protein
MPILSYRRRAQHKWRAALTSQDRQHMTKENTTTTTNTGTGEGKLWHAVVAKPRDSPLETALILHQLDFQNLDPPSRLRQMPH